MARGKSKFLDDVREFLLQQLLNATAQSELKRMAPRGVDWVQRTRETIDTVLPRLPGLAKFLVEMVPQNLNSSIRVLEQIKHGEEHLAAVLKSNEKIRTWYRELSVHAERARHLIGNLESQQISAEIQRLIISPDGLGDLVRMNGGSIYPDVLLIQHDYSMLPRQNRSNPIEGACLRGANPSNIPDGIEIKTNQGNRIKVDAHGAHAGLHLGVTWDLVDGTVKVTGVWIGYVKIADHREGGRNVKVTTVKYSFGHDLFISLLDS